ncbi:MAG: hypothetical protein M1812_001086 [Candelaria pacifica]|nr:MAG: hypothetical protein M1812_001086 [Candelaria pacifica]
MRFPEELAAMDLEISTLNEETTIAKADEKALKATLNTLKTTMSTLDLREAVHALELEIKQIEARLNPLRSGNVVPVSAEERALVEKEWKEAKRVGDVRRKGCMSLWADLSEQLPEGITKDEMWVSFATLLCPRPSKLLRVANTSQLKLKIGKVGTRG